LSAIQQGIMGRTIDRDALAAGDAFPARLRSAIERSGGATRIAQESGIPLSTLHNYLAGRSEPKRRAIAVLADILQLDPWWLLTGEDRGASQPSDGRSAAATGGTVDLELLGDVAAALISLYDEIGCRLEGHTFGRKCGQIHNAIRAAAADAREQRTMLRLAVALHREELLGRS
jgi:transcriptional regulator with XRE-family HTH domain